MASKIPKNLKEKLTVKRIRKRWSRLGGVLAGMIVFCVTYALILPAITMSSQQANCGLEEHEHLEECFDAEGNLICGLEEHIHSLDCYADLDADIENEELWDAEIPELTADRNADVVSIAKSLVGYRESDRNYLVTDENQTQGYSRFGHWYGEMLDSVLREEAERRERLQSDEAGEPQEEQAKQEEAEEEYSGDTAPRPETVFAGEEENGCVTRLENNLPAYSYLDWNAMFVSYVLHYAQITELGFETDADSWVGTLSASERYIDASAGYIPTEGDLVFYAPPAASQSADAKTGVGIISHVNRNVFGLGGDVSSLSVIVGDYDNSVSEIEIPVNKQNDAIETAIGYGVLTPGVSEDEEPQDESITGSIVDYISGIFSPADESVTDNGEQAESDTPTDDSAVFESVDESDVPDENTEEADPTETHDGKSDSSDSFDADESEAGTEKKDANTDESFTEGKAAPDEKDTVGASSGESSKSEDSQKTADKAESEAEKILAAADRIAEKKLISVRDDYKVTMTYGPEAEIPEGAKLKVSEIMEDSEEYQQYIADSRKALGMSDEDVDELCGRFFDIKIMTEDGEFEPKAPVTVNIEYKKAMETEDSSVVSAVHFAEEGAAQIDVDTTESDGKVKGVAFEAESFSVYGVVYTVDFHWEVEGKSYEFSLPGGGYVSLETLMEIIGAADDAMEAAGDEKTAEDGAAAEEAGSKEVRSNALTLDDVRISAATKQFVEDVADVTFSDPDLVWVGKTDADSTVGELKTEKGLEVQYSKELTDEQIEKVDAQNVKNGEWALISVSPFLSEETLTVTMKDGESFTVRVTDAQISRIISTSDSNSWKITVTYGPEAGIPEGAELIVSEIRMGDEGYDDYCNQASELARADALANGIEDPVIMGQHMFDIEIRGEGGKIEPEAPVRVDIRMLGKPAGKLSVIHFADNGPESLDVTDTAVYGSWSEKAVDAENISDENSEKGDTEAASETESGDAQGDRNDGEVQDENTSGEDSEQGEALQAEEAAYEISFEADSFSVYNIVDVSQFTNGTFAIVSDRGPGIYVMTDDVNHTDSDIFRYAMTSSPVDYRINDSLSTDTRAGKVVYLDKAKNTYGGDVSEWGFEPVNDNGTTRYLLYTEVNGVRQYIRTNYTGLNLTTDTSVADKFEIEQDTTNNKIRIRRPYFNEQGELSYTYYLSNNGGNPSYFETTGQADRDTWFTLASRDPNYDEEVARKVSAEDWTSTKFNEADTVMIYRKVVDHETGAETLYALATDGTFVQVYDGGDSIYYHSAGKDFGWHIGKEEGKGYTIASANPENRVYISPSLTDGKCIHDTPVELNMEGMNAAYGSAMEVWHQDAYTYVGMHMNETNHTAEIGSGAYSDTFYFAVIDPEEQVTPGELHPVDTVDSTSLGITLKMFDYTAPNTYWHGYRNPLMQSIMGDDMIDHWNDELSRKSHVTKTVESRLGSDGFPVSLSNGNSYAPLFTTGTHEISYAGNNGEGPRGYSAGTGTIEGWDANNLFLQSYYDETGMFRYSSMENYARFNPDTGDFTVYREAGTPNTPRDADHYYFYHGHFTPLNDLNPDVNVARIVDQYGFLESQEEGRTYEDVYGIVQPTNYYVGMSMEAKFTQPHGGTLENGDPVIFKFTGDDDLLVYIDNILVLDVGGIHEPLTGEIDFETGIVKQPNFYEQGEGWKYHYRTLYDIFEEAYRNGNLSESEWDKMQTKFKDADGDGKLDTFADFSTHQFNLFYMERGAGASNLDLQFNLQTVKSNEFTVEKDLPDGVDATYVNQKYKYRAVYEDHGTVKPLHSGIADVCDSVVYKNVLDPTTHHQVPITIDQEGYFYLYPGEVALFKMENEAIIYNVYEVGIDDTLIEKVSINGEEKSYGANDGTGNNIGTGGTGYDGSTGTAASDGNVAGAGYEAVMDRSQVVFMNYPYLRKLRITKHLLTPDSRFDHPDSQIGANPEVGEDPRFEFFVYMESRYDRDGNLIDDLSTSEIETKLIPYKNGPYYLVKTVNGVDHYYTLDGVNNSPVDHGTTPVECAKTGRNGTISSIPPEYTIVIPDTAAGTHFYVTERESTMPGGYQYIDADLTANENYSYNDPAFALDENSIIRADMDRQDLDDSVFKSIKYDKDADSHFYNNKKAVKVPVEKKWDPEDVTPKPTPVVLSLVRYKAPVPEETHNPPEGMGAIRIKHDGLYINGENEMTAALPGFFDMRYRITNVTTGQVVVSDTKSAGPFDLVPGIYQVETIVINADEPADYQYVKTDPVQVEVIEGEVVKANVISEYNYVPDGFVDISHISSGLLDTPASPDLPEGFTAVYTIRYAGDGGSYVWVNVEPGTYNLSPGNYEITASIIDPAAPDGYTYLATTEKVNVTITEFQTSQAQFTSTYTKNGTIKIHHESDGISGTTDMPEGFRASYIIYNDEHSYTAEYDASEDVEVSVMPGTYTVSTRITDPAAPVGMSYSGTPAVENVTVTGGTTTQADVVSSYTTTPVYVRLTIRESYMGPDGPVTPTNFSAGYTILGPTNTTANKDQTVSVLTGDYEIKPNLWNEGTVEGLVYAGMDEIVNHTVSGDEEITVVHRYVAPGTLEINHTSNIASLNNEMPSGFDPQYTISKNGSTWSTTVQGLNTSIQLPPGTYTVELTNVYGEGNVPAYYTRDLVNPNTGEGIVVRDTVTVTGGSTSTADLVSTYSYNPPPMKTYTVTIHWEDKNGLEMPDGPDTGSITLPIRGQYTEGNGGIAGTVTLSPANNWTAVIDLPEGGGNQGSYTVDRYLQNGNGVTVDPADLIKDQDQNSGTKSLSDSDGGTFEYHLKWNGSSAADITYTLAPENGGWTDKYGNTLSSGQLPTSGTITVPIRGLNYNVKGNFILAPSDWTATTSLPYGEGDSGEYQVVNDNVDISQAPSVKSFNMVTRTGTDVADATLTYRAVSNESPFETKLRFQGEGSSGVAVYYYDSNNTRTVVEGADGITVSDGTEINVPLKVNNTSVTQYEVRFGYHTQDKLNISVAANGNSVTVTPSEIQYGNTTFSFSATEGPIVITVTKTRGGRNAANVAALHGIMMSKANSISADSVDRDSSDEAQLSQQEDDAERTVGAVDRNDEDGESSSSDVSQTGDVIGKGSEDGADSGSPILSNEGGGNVSSQMRNSSLLSGILRAAGGLRAVGDHVVTPVDINPLDLTIPQEFVQTVTYLEENIQYALDPGFGLQIELNGEEATPWKYEFEHLPEYDEYGQRYWYALVENQVPTDFEVSYQNNPRSAEVIEGDGTISLTATNRKTIGDLELTKRVNGNVPPHLQNADFTFTVTLTAPQGKTLAETYQVVKYYKSDPDDPQTEQTLTLNRTDENTKASFTVTLKKDQTWWIKDLPVGTRYQIAETNEQEIANQFSSETTSGNTVGTITAETSSNPITSVEVTNTHSPRVTQVEATKEWVSGQQVVAWPEDVEYVEFTLYAVVPGFNNGDPLPINNQSIESYFRNIEAVKQIKANAKHATWSDLPIHPVPGQPGTTVSYSVRETKIVYTDASGILPKEKEVDITAENDLITNELPKKSVSATKQWVDYEGNQLTGSNIPAGAKVTFTLYRDGQVVMVSREVGGETVTSPRMLELDGSDATSGGTVTPTTDDYVTGWVANFTNLPMYKDNGEKYVYTVKETGSWSGFYIDGSDTAADGGTIVNKEKVLTLDILKRIKDTTQPLEGAEFTLDRIDGTSAAISKITGSGAVHKTVTTNDQGVAAFENLPIGYYEITETKVPRGYVLTEKSTFYIHVKDKEGTTSENIYLLTPVEGQAPNRWNEQTTSYGSVKTFTLKSNLANAQALIENTPGAELPTTGGPGTGLMTALGIMLMVMSGAVLVMRRRTEIRIRS